MARARIGCARSTIWILKDPTGVNQISKFHDLRLRDNRGGASSDTEIRWKKCRQTRPHLYRATKGERLRNSEIREPLRARRQPVSVVGRFIFVSDLYPAEYKLDKHSHAP